MRKGAVCNSHNVGECVKVAEIGKTMMLRSDLEIHDNYHKRELSNDFPNNVVR